MLPEENTSGNGDFAKVPAEIDKWNWEAFTFGWLWARKYKFPLAITKKIIYRSIWNPFYGLYLGRKGNSLLWKHLHWESVESFQKHQQKENRVAKAYLVYLFIYVIVITSIFLLLGLTTHR